MPLAAIIKCVKGRHRPTFCKTGGKFSRGDRTPPKNRLGKHDPIDRRTACSILLQTLPIMMPSPVEPNKKKPKKAKKVRGFPLMGTLNHRTTRKEKTVQSK